MNAEGWYVDPYGSHDARWFSEGTPTALVRDGDVESGDDPPDSGYEGPLDPIVGFPPSSGPDELGGVDRSDLELDAESEIAFESVLDDTTSQD